MEESGKILVELCFGTTCFVMGASKLQELESLIPPQYRFMQKCDIHESSVCKN